MEIDTNQRCFKILTSKIIEKEGLLKNLIDKKKILRQLEGNAHVAWFF